ncbi:hypothetical protein K3495_g5610 [Podosphaera aphanis]|nr:hypothetical protein K3495_g5610 [Podosphaera aphanis]
MRRGLGHMGSHGREYYALGWEFDEFALDLSEDIEPFYKYINKFKTTIRSYHVGGGELADIHVIGLFKQPVKENAGRWHGMVSAVARFQRWSLEQLFQDFASTHLDRVGIMDRKTCNKPNDPGRKSVNISQGEVKNARQQGPNDNTEKKNPARYIRC